MKTKTIPFDLETAKKIQAGEIEGKIKTRNDRYVDILCFNRKSVSDAPIVALIHFHVKEDLVLIYTETGYVSSDMDDESLNLVLEVPDNEPQFKPFDKVLVRENDASLWRAGFYSHELDGNHCVCEDYYKQCIPYEGNEHLVGTTNKPKEE